MARITGNKTHTLTMLPWTKYPRRRCRSLHHCEICCADIRLGEEYFDGGFSRRAHVACIEDGFMPESRERSEES